MAVKHFAWVAGIVAAAVVIDVAGFLIAVELMDGRVDIGI